MNLIPFLSGPLFSKSSNTYFGAKRKSQNQRFLLSAFLILSTMFASLGVSAQDMPNEAEWNGEGYSLKKIASNTTIQSGVYFSYTILFSAPAGATTINIQDNVPVSLGAISVPPPSDVNGVTPVVGVSGNLVTYTLTGLPGGMASSGSFTIVVKFPEGTTCNGTSARNKAEILVNDKWQSTPYVSTTAVAADPWKVSKSILSGAVVNPTGGACGYLMNEGDTIKYRLSVLKNSPYWGNFVGQENMTSAVVTDILPPGAVFISATTPYTPVSESGGTITWNIGTLNAATSYAYYYCDVEIYYPVGSFPSGSFIYNELDLDGDICNQAVNHTSNETCIEVGEVISNPSGYFKKYIALTNRVPGCDGYYAIAFCNNGNVDLSAFNIDDVIPAGITVDNVAVYGANATTTINLTANSGANTIATGLTSNYNPGSLAFTVNDLQLGMTGVLPVGSCIYLYIYFTVDSNPAGTVVENCATFDGLSSGLTIPDPTCVTFTVAQAIPDPCLIKDICSPQASYDPGDIVRFRLRVQNIGSDDISGASIQDVLHSNFTYVGNASYYVANSYNPPCSVGGAIPAGSSIWTGVSFSQVGNDLSWSLPDIPSDCQSFYTAYCGYYGTWGLPYYYIEFDVEVSNTAMPGVTTNAYSITGGNLPSTETSNTVNVLVVASFGQEVEKLISTDGGTTYAASGTTSASATARYRLSYKNMSNVPVSNINLVDLLAFDADPLDLLVLNRGVARGSQFGVDFMGTPSTSVVPSGTGTALYSFSPGENICLPPFGIVGGGCVAPLWSTSTEENILIKYGTFSLLPTYAVLEDFNVQIADSAELGETVCNDFAALSTADFLLDGVPQSVTLTPISAPPVCLTIAENQESCCEDVTVEQVAGAECCVQLKTTCKIKVIKLELSNGTISSASADCGTITPGFIGGTSLTFSGGCIPTISTCFTPNSSGIVTGVYTILFENGEECEKPLEMDCEIQPINCCDSIKIEQVVNAVGEEECCVKITSECEVKSVEVMIDNGTISSASWSCGTIPAGYEGMSSYSFDVDPTLTCEMGLTLCVDAIESGVVSITYIITTVDGEICQKSFEMDCKAIAINCCDSIQIEQVVSADGVEECCLNLTSVCDVKSVEVIVYNGTIASASWNCGTIPSGYEGEDSFTFDADPDLLCALDMTLCFDALETGIVSVTYIITTVDGEVCQKSYKMDCKETAINCCDSIQFEQVFDSTGEEKCCVNLTSVCEVQSVEVIVENGTIASASWNCGTLPAGYEGESSFTFDTDPDLLCALDMTLCYDALETGIVSVTYIITTVDGEVCQKGFKMDCEVTAINCCDSVQIEQLVSADGIEECCVKLSSVCEVRSIEVNVFNGTIASASWNCGIIPADFEDESSYTFEVSDSVPCATDLTLCFDALETGIVSVSYVVTFANGEVCQKGIEIKCDPVQVDCCELIEVEQVVDANGELDCCAKIVSECEVKSVEVKIQNGTIASADWNCGALPSGYLGTSNYVFSPGNCALNMVLCVDADVSGIVIIDYIITLENGEVCEKRVELKCEAVIGDCCDSINLYPVQDEGCCVKLTSECKVEEVKVEIQNGTFASASWNCGTMPAGFVGQSSFGFTTGGCTDLSMLLCVDAEVSGPVVIDYYFILADGTECEKRIELECEAPAESDCCPIVDFTLKNNWPWFNTQVGTFEILNPDPTTPICSVEINATSVGTFTTGNLWIDNSISGQSWTATDIPASGSLSPVAVNSIKFNLIATGYKGVVEICVIKCDGTRCCYEFKWNKKPWIDISGTIDHVSITHPLFALTAMPIIDSDVDAKIKYVSFGIDEAAIEKQSNVEFFAISGANHEEDDTKGTEIESAYMGAYNAFFELQTASPAKGDLGLYNLVFSNSLPDVNLTLFDDEGNIVFTGVSSFENGQIVTSFVELDMYSGGSGNMFEFINLYPNPNNGQFKITYAIGDEKDINLQVVNAKGQVVTEVSTPAQMPGVHETALDAGVLPAGNYKMILRANGVIQTKSFVVK